MPGISSMATLPPTPNSPLSPPHPRPAPQFKEDVKGMMPGGGQERTSYEHEKHTEGRTGF